MTALRLFFLFVQTGISLCSVSTIVIVENPNSQTYEVDNRNNIMNAFTDIFR